MDDHVPRDSVDALLASWAASRPDLDFSPVAVITRLARLRRHIDVELQEAFEAHGLSAGTFAVLATLARLGPRTREQLMDEIGLAAPELDERLTALTAGGLTAVGEQVTLTDRGGELFERAVADHLANERRLLLALSPAEQEALAGLLRRLLVEFEGSRAEGEAPLGVTLSPAHLTAKLRREVGAEPVTGLAVQSVAEGGAAARAGLRRGDLLLGLRSVADLYAALATGPATLRVLRGDQEREVTLESAAVEARSPGRAAFAGHVV